LLSIAYFAALLKKSDLLVVSLLIDFNSFSGRITLTLIFFSTGAGSLISSPSAINTSSKQEKASICTRKGSAAAKKGYSLLEALYQTSLDMGHSREEITKHYTEF